ncbi:hypothetical protein SAMN05421509_10371 [Chromohalobacter canadensis]|uniref:Uncharacterized protein n=1 Tax=Chromohalobacter canadensis TaxID=141389 RepID=A0A285VN72_9GAMM|nr:hypothetical protein SAMN05421509_10371 [Chromohalobacter canadensis]
MAYGGLSGIEQDDLTESLIDCHSSISIYLTLMRQ